MKSVSLRRVWSYLRRSWINARRIRFWAIVLLVVYTLAGFFGVPWIVRNAAIATVEEDYGRELSVGEVRANPYTFTLRVDGLALDDTDGQRLAVLDRLFVDFTPASLFEWAWAFQAIRLEGLEIRAERFASGDSRLARLLRDASAKTGGSGGREPGAMPALLIRDLRVDGTVRIIDRVPAETVELRIDALTFRAEDVGTRAGKTGRQSGRLVLASGGAMTWQGTLRLAPFRSHGVAELDGLVADRFVTYVRSRVPLTGLHLVADASFEYTVDASDAAPGLVLSGLQLRVSDLALSAFEPETEFLTAKGVRLEGGSYRYGDNYLRIARVRIEEPRLRTWLDPDGRVGLMGLLPDGATNTATAARPLSLELDRLRVGGLELALEDRSTDPPTPIALHDVELALDDLSLQEGAAFPTRLEGQLAKGGAVAFDGQLQLSPAFDLVGAVRVDALDLGLVETYLQQLARVRIDTGTVSLDGQMAIDAQEPLAYRGRVGIERLDVVEQASGEPVVGWQRLQVERLDLRLGARTVETSLISIDQPFARVIIGADQTTNLGRLLVDPPERGDAPGPAPTVGINIARIALADGALSFADRSLPLPFSTRAHSLEGQVSTLASDTAEPAEVRLEGQVTEYGLARIEGDVNAWQPMRETRLRLEFRNLRMPDYSPYTVAFAGRRIAAGRMDLDLAYTIDEGRLEGSNDIVLRDLELGEKVDHPDAMSLPLGLAVALLKDSDGVIDIAVPVKGDVGHPEFDLGGVIAQAVARAIKKVIKSPFSFLAKLVGSDSEDLGRIEFPPGRSDLTPPQMQRIAQLREALAKRPELALEFAGPFDPALDRPELKRRQALVELERRLEASGTRLDAPRLTAEGAQDVLEAMFSAHYSAAELAEARVQFTRAAEGEDDGGPGFDAVAYRNHLAERVVAAQTVTGADLEDLATARARAARHALLGLENHNAATGGDVQPDRVHLRSPERVDAGEADRVILEVGLAKD